MPEGIAPTDDAASAMIPRSAEGRQSEQTVVVAFRTSFFKRGGERWPREG